MIEKQNAESGAPPWADLLDEKRCRVFRICVLLLSGRSVEEVSRLTSTPIQEVADIRDEKDWCHVMAEARAYVNEVL